MIELIVNPVGGMRGEEILTPSELRIMKWYRSVFGVFLVRVSGILTESGEIPRISPYSVLMPKNTDQKFWNTETFHTVLA